MYWGARSTILLRKRGRERGGGILLGGGSKMPGV